MDNIGTKPESTKAIKAEFWKGVMLGTMAGMIIAAFTYEVVDRDLRNLLKGPEMAPDRGDSRSTLPGVASEKTAA
jgi:hypothetical protein